MTVVWIFSDIDNSADPLPIFLLQVFITLILTRILGKILSYFHQPRVMGEIIGGIFLGPSLFGLIPNFTNTIFPTFSTNPFIIVGNIGLILFMFITGVELDPLLLKKLWKTSVPIALSAIFIPFGVGCLLSLWLWNYNNNGLSNWTDPSWTAFVLFCGTSFSFTAFPVLASILAATKLLNTPLGIQAISAAAVDDISAWTILAISSAFATSGNGLNGFYVFLCSCIFLFTMLIIIRPLIQKVHDYFKERSIKNKHAGIHDAELNELFILFIFIIIITAAFTTEVIGIHAFFGSFIAGICMPKEEGSLMKQLIPKIELPVMNLLLPLYFANSGIRTDVTKINSAELGGVTVVICVIAITVKFIPAFLTTRIVTKREWRFCAAIGALMNTRGLVELIALNVGLQYGIFSVRMFTMFILMAILTTLMTSPLLWIFYQRKYEEEEIKNKIPQLAQIKRHASLEDIFNQSAAAEQPVTFPKELNEEKRNNKLPTPELNDSQIEGKSNHNSGVGDFVVVQQSAMMSGGDALMEVNIENGEQKNPAETAATRPGVSQTANESSVAFHDQDDSV